MEPSSSPSEVLAAEFANDGLEDDIDRAKKLQQTCLLCKRDCRSIRIIAEDLKNPGKIFFSFLSPLSFFNPTELSQQHY